MLCLDELGPRAKPSQLPPNKNSHHRKREEFAKGPAKFLETLSKSSKSPSKEFFVHYYEEPVFVMLENRGLQPEKNRRA